MEKVINYTPEMTAEIVAGYEAGEAVEALAARFSRSTRSIVAKLSREGVYKAKAAGAKAARVSKAELITRIATAIGVDETVIESLEKATGVALTKVAEALEAK